MYIFYIDRIEIMNQHKHTQKTNKFNMMISLVVRNSSGVNVVIYIALYQKWTHTQTHKKKLTNFYCHTEHSTTKTFIEIAGKSLRIGEHYESWLVSCDSHFLWFFNFFLLVRVRDRLVNNLTWKKNRKKSVVKSTKLNFF